MKKEYPKEDVCLQELLNGILSNKYYTIGIDTLRQKGFEKMTIGISSACFSVLSKDRYTIQYIKIPADKRGNLSKYRGENVQIIATIIPSRTQSIEFFIKKI